MVNYERAHNDRLKLLQDRLEEQNARYDQVVQRRAVLIEEQERLKSIYRNRHSSADWTTAEHAFVNRALSKLKRTIFSITSVTQYLFIFQITILVAN